MTTHRKVVFLCPEATKRREVRQMRRTELVERIRELGGIESTERAQLVLRAVLDALRSEVTEADRGEEAGHYSDIADTEEMLCEEESTTEAVM